jgi:hypothetical protein
VGWAFVEEYLRCDLAEDEQEDRYIRRCEAAAVEKRRLRQESGNKGRGGGSRGRGRQQSEHGDSKRPQRSEFADHPTQQGYQEYQTYPSYQGQGQGPTYVAQAPYYQQPQRQYAQYAQPHGASPYHRQLGPCFKCGGAHLVRHCPENDRVTADVQDRIEDDYYQY